jgi:hypothetical protein
MPGCALQHSLFGAKVMMAVTVQAEKWITKQDGEVGSQWKKTLYIEETNVYV